MWVSQLAERSGVPASTLRFYETVGLLPAERTESGYRMYHEDAVERLGFIATGKHLGLSLDEIGELLAVRDSGPCAEVKSDLRPRLARRLASAERRVVEVSEFVVSLRAALEHLEALPDRWQSCGLECDFPLETAGKERWRDADVACALSGEDAAGRAQQWRRALAGARRHAIADGVRLSLPAERAGEAAALAVAEQQCCPFFDFRFQVDGPMLHLDIRAPAEAAGLLTDLFAPGDVPATEHPPKQT